MLRISRYGVIGLNYMIRHLKKHKNCIDCRALWENGKDLKCHLGYPVKWDYSYEFGHPYKYVKPLKECPKPMQWRTYDKSPVFLNV